jgi:cell division septal protein FtsQ
MKKMRIPRPRRYASFAEKFGRGAAFFGSREKKQRDTYGHLPHLIFGMLGVMVLTLAVLLLGRLWKVTSVSADNGVLYTSAAVLEHADIDVGDEMLGFDRAAVEKRLRERLPLLDEIRIRKGAGGAVTIRFTEVTDLYYTRHNVNYYILNAKTREVLCVSATPQEARRVGAVYVGLPETARVRVGETVTFINLPYEPENTGIELSTYEVETYEPEVEHAYVFTVVETLMSSSLASRVVGMELGNRYDLWLVLKGGIKVRLGTTDELERKLSVAERSLAEREEQGGISDAMPTLVDVSDPARVIHRSSPDIEMPDWAD